MVLADRCRSGHLHGAVEPVPGPAGSPRKDSGRLAGRTGAARQIPGEHLGEVGEPRRRQPRVEAVLCLEARGGAVLVDPLLDRSDHEIGVLERQPAPEREKLDVGIPGSTQHGPELGELVAQRVGDRAVQDRAVDRQGSSQPPGGHSGVVDGHVVSGAGGGDGREQSLRLGRDVRLHDLARGPHPPRLARRRSAREDRPLDAHRVGRTLSALALSGARSGRWALLCCRSTVDQEVEPCRRADDSSCCSSPPWR